MIKFQFFPRSVGINEQIQKIIDCFNAVDNQICSPEHTLSSNEVLTILRETLLAVPMQVERGKTKGLKIPVPVLFGLNNKIDQHFDADALSSDGKIVLEVEAGRAVDNYQFLKDIFQACMMYGVEYLVLAVRNDYRKHDDFKKIYSFLVPVQHLLNNKDINANCIMARLDSRNRSQFFHSLRHFSSQPKDLSTTHL